MFEEHSKRVQELIGKIDSVGTGPARALLHDCVQSLLAMYGEGLGRILKLVRESETGGQEAIARLADDPVVRGLLLIHDLHPQGLESRLHAGLEKVRPYLQSHGGNVELVGLENGVAHLGLQGACKTCAASSVTLELAVKQAVEEACPDLVGFEVEGIKEEPTSPLDLRPSSLVLP